MENQMSLIEISLEIMESLDGPINIYTLIEETLAKKGISDPDGTIAAKLYTDITISSKFVYMGDDNWDLKSRQSLDQFDKDGSSFISKDEEYEDETVDEDEDELDDSTSDDYEDDEDEEDEESDDEEDEDNYSDEDEDELDDEDDKYVEDEESDEDEDEDNYSDDDEDKYNKIMDDYEDLYED
ncbi:MAG: DNA-directed RNA polymerase subunit delta [Acholeplasmatales bacterium]|nr:DNA-directed RNA polymerase subunit delta [Acholeplasmatales bacterium]